MDIDVDDAVAATRRGRTGPPRRKLTAFRFCLYVAGVFVLILAGLFAYGICSIIRKMFLVNATPMNSVQHPHAAKKIGVKGKELKYNESEVVRSFFGKSEHGGVIERMDLYANVWYRPSFSDGWLETGNVDPFDSTANSWQLMYHAKVFGDLSPDRRKAFKTHVNVSLPFSVVNDLRNSVNETVAASLIATFELLPASGSLASTKMTPIDYHHFYEPPKDNIPAWPVLAPPYAPPPTSDPSHDGFVAQMSGFATAVGTSFGLPRSPAVFAESSDSQAPLADMMHMATAPGWLLSRPLERNNGSWIRLQPRLKTTSWVTMVREKPVYALDKFREKMKEIREMQILCANSAIKLGRPPADSDCRASVNTIGHAAGLLELRDAGDERAATKHWRYPPFLSSQVGIMTPKDVIDLPSSPRSPENAGSENFEFQWQIGFSTSSTLKLDLVMPIVANMLSQGQSNMTDYERASFLDSAAWFSALLNIHHDTQSRPLVRSFLYFIAGFCGMITDLSLLHYLLTRSLTTGISLQPLVTALVAGVLKNFKSHPQWDADGGMWFAYTVVAVLTSFELLLAINVACRLEWQWWGAGWVTRWIPCGVIRRRPTHSERTSSRRDWEFGWLHRLALFAAILAFAYQAANFHIVHADPPQSPTDKYLPPPIISKGFDDFLDKALWALVTGSIAQLVLNARSKTFAGLHRIGAYCAFATSLCNAIPVVFHRFFGRHELMDPLMTGHVFDFCVTAWQAWQATIYPTVAQEEPENE